MIRQILLDGGYMSYCKLLLLIIIDLVIILIPEYRGGNLYLTLCVMNL